MPPVGWTAGGVAATIDQPKDKPKSYIVLDEPKHTSGFASLMLQLEQGLGMSGDSAAARALLEPFRAVMQGGLAVRFLETADDLSP